MYDETHQIQIALITKCGLYTHGSLFTLPYLSINAFRNQNGTHVNLECTMKTHQIQITLITKCGLYTHGSLFNLLYLSINISRCIQKRTHVNLECTMTNSDYIGTLNTVSTITPCSLYCIWVPIYISRSTRFRMLHG